MKKSCEFHLENRSESPASGTMDHLVDDSGLLLTLDQVDDPDVSFYGPQENLENLKKAKGNLESLGEPVEAVEAQKGPKDDQNQEESKARKARKRPRDEDEEEEGGVAKRPRPGTPTEGEHEFDSLVHDSSGLQRGFWRGSDFDLGLLGESGDGPSAIGQGGDGSGALSESGYGPSQYNDPEVTLDSWPESRVDLFTGSDDLAPGPGSAWDFRSVLSEGQGDQNPPEPVPGVPEVPSSLESILGSLEDQEAAPAGPPNTQEETYNSPEPSTSRHLESTLC